MQATTPWSIQKWIPGEHGPTGPIDNLAGVKFSAAGKEIPWRRDDVDMYAFHVSVPQGVTALDVKLDFLATAAASGFLPELRPALTSRC